MMSRISYHFINPFSRLGYLIILCLILFITAKPVDIVIFNLFDVNCELCGIYGEEDSKEKELFDDDESKDQEFNFSCFAYQKIYYKQNITYFYFHNFFTDYNPDIPLPPPKKDVKFLSYFSFTTCRDEKNVVELKSF